MSKVPKLRTLVTTFLLVSLLALSVSMAMAPSADADEGYPCAYTGLVFVDDTAVSDDTPVRVLQDSTVLRETTTGAGDLVANRYYMDGVIAVPGTVVNFEIWWDCPGEGAAWLPADETATHVQWGIVGQDLHAQCGSAPTITTNAASSVTHYSVTLNGNLGDMGDYTSVDVYFEYGTTTSYGSTTSAVTKTAIGAFSAYTSGLSPDTLYHFRAVGGYDSEDVYGIDRTFTTLEGPAWPFTRTLCAGWNALSTPVKLESTGNANKFGQIVPPAALNGTAYRLYGNYWYPVTSYYVLKPLEGIYVNIVAGGTTATFVPEDGISAPPTRSLYTGWSLIGPAPGYDGGFPETPAMENLICMMTGGYFDGEFSFSNVVSPPLCQDGWTFNPWYYGSEPDMVPFKGYFVYMEKYDTLVGYSTTPLQ